MVCDKCGFEHNSRSVCPKCGTRVVYVNEDYLRRRQEWEEAQKQGRKDALPPGIMHSTREEHEAAKGKADKAPKTSKGGPETVSLSFRVKKCCDAVKAFFIKCISKLTDFYKKHFGKKRGANNPVIKELKFDETPDTLDESKLVLSHKVFKDYRKYYFMGGGALILIIALIIIIVNIVHSIDRSNVWYFDGKYAYWVSDTDKPVFGNMHGGILVITNENGDCLAYDESMIYLFSDDKIWEYEAQVSQIIAYNDAFDTVVYMEEGKTHLLYNQEIIELDMPINTEYTQACMVSDDGRFYTLAVCENNDTYSLYLGTSSGELEIVQKSNKAVEVYGLSKTGIINYVEMSTAEYGIVNERNLMQYDGEVKCLAENVDRYKWMSEGAYFTSEENKLYYVSAEVTKTFVDEDVSSFVTNVLNEEELYYYKNGGCYTLSDDMPYYICDMAKEGCELIYDKDHTLKFYYDRNNIYVTDKDVADKYSLMSDGSFVFHENNNMLYVLEDTGELIRITDKNSSYILADSADAIISVEGMSAIAYTDENGINILEDDSKKSLKIYEESVLNKVVFSHKKFYLTDKDGILWSISANGKKSESLGNVEIYNFVD